MTIRSYARVGALLGAAAALIAGALALWLSAAPPSGAASVDHPQGTTVTVADRTISWGSAGDCVQDMGTADFGSMLPGTNVSAVGFFGCVTSNADGWAVSADATDLTTADLTTAADTIAKENLAVFTSGLSGSALSASLPCNGTLCSLTAPQTVLTGGAAGTGGFEYGLNLAVPPTTPNGVYNGTVTFTASN